MSEPLYFEISESHFENKTRSNELIVRSLFYRANYIQQAYICTDEAMRLLLVKCTTEIQKMLLEAWITLFDKYTTIHFINGKGYIKLNLPDEYSDLYKYVATYALSTVQLLHKGPIVYGELAERIYKKYSQKSIPINADILGLVISISYTISAEQYEKIIQYLQQKLAFSFWFCEGDYIVFKGLEEELHELVEELAQDLKGNHE